MTSRRIIKGVLHNFLGTFTSRHSDFDGYWVFGYLVDGLDWVRIDLLDISSGSAEATPSGFTRRLATQKFAEQIAKAGLPKTWFREARLEMSRPTETRLGVVNGRTTPGYDVKCHALAVTDLGQTYDAALSIFVAAHDPKIELRSARAI